MEVVKQRKAGQDTGAEAKGVAGSLSVDRQDLRTSELTGLFTVGPALHSVSFRQHTFTQGNKLKGPVWLHSGSSPMLQ